MGRERGTTFLLRGPWRRSHSRAVSQARHARHETRNYDFPVGAASQRLSHSQPPMCRPHLFTMRACMAACTKRDRCLGQTESEPLGAKVLIWRGATGVVGSEREK